MDLHGESNPGRSHGSAMVCPLCTMVCPHSYMLAEKNIAGLVVLLIFTNYSKIFCEQISAMHFFIFKL